MHRQSLGSPASKLQCHGILFAGDGAINNDCNNNNIAISEDHRNDKLAPFSAGEEHKLQKPNQQKSINASSSSSRLVHLIPILTFFCFLILYLFSHDTSSIDDVGGGSMAIRSVRNLQPQDRLHFHRKFWH